MKKRLCVINKGEDRCIVFNKNKKKRTYYIALDIGVASVGWVVLDENFNIIKYKKRNMWGSNLFNEGQTAEGTRKKRCNGRRKKRKKSR